MNDAYELLIIIRKLGQVHELTQLIGSKSIGIDGSFRSTRLKKGKLGIDYLSSIN
jgi:hypothetical protein